MYGLSSASWPSAPRHQRLDFPDRTEPGQPLGSSLKKVLDAFPWRWRIFSPGFGGQPQVFFPREELSDIGTASVELRLVAAAWPSAACPFCTSAMHPTPTPARRCSPTRARRAASSSGENRTHGGRRVEDPGSGRRPTTSRVSLPHRFRNVGREDCEIVSASSPPTFNPRPAAACMRTFM